MMCGVSLSARIILVTAALRLRVLFPLSFEDDPQGMYHDFNIQRQ